MLPKVTDNYRWEWLKIPLCRQLSELSSLPHCSDGGESRKEFWETFLPVPSFQHLEASTSNEYLFSFPPKSGKSRSPPISYSAAGHYQIHLWEIQALFLIWNLKPRKRYSQKTAKICKGNFRSQHSGHILTSVSAHPVSIKEHNDGNISWKGRVYELDGIN